MRLRTKDTNPAVKFLYKPKYRLK